MKQFPFPIEILQVPQVQRMTPSEFGLLMRLALEYWNTGLQLPESDYAIVRLSNSDYGAWKRCKQKVTEALCVIMPGMKAQHEHAVKKALGRRYIALLGGAANATRIKQLANQTIKNVVRLADNDINHVGIVPIESPRKDFNKGKTDPISRAKAIKSTKKSSGVKLVDE